ncbi:hypothetical protein ACPOLB_20965 [Rubrivivax sp. RP6-9]|uniref:hypothetical protein n=1 Tax=Rubrivivax sp. RP6-9 TaxID=3415750 RepID=UPI003CC566C9
MLKTLSMAVCALALQACAVAPPAAPGQSQADLQQRLGTPTGRYALPDGATRLEFARGPFGRETWMVDVDASGRATAVRQVLNEASFAAFQARAPGMPRDELLRTLGRPGERRHGGWQGGEVWSWRYPTNDCLWFQVSIGDDGLVRDGAYGIDPRCDAASDRQ